MSYRNFAASFNDYKSSFQNVDFSTTLKAVFLAGYMFVIVGLGTYCAELIKTEVKIICMREKRNFKYVSHIKIIVIFVFYL
jgi:hypothetical protein